MQSLRLGALCLLAALASCGSVTVASQSPAWGYPGVPRRILVADAFIGTGAASHMRFEQAMQEKFSQCNVTAGDFFTGGLQLDLAARQRAAAAAMQADAVLTVQPVQVTQFGPNQSNQTYALSLRDLTTGTEAWRGTVDLSRINFLTVDRVTEDFARQVVQQLVDAVVIKTCPKQT